MENLVSAENLKVEILQRISVFFCLYLLLNIMYDVFRLIYFNLNSIFWPWVIYSHCRKMEKRRKVYKKWLRSSFSNKRSSFNWCRTWVFPVYFNILAIITSILILRKVSTEGCTDCRWEEPWNEGLCQTVCPSNLCKNILTQPSKMFFNYVSAPGLCCNCSSFFCENNLQFSVWIRPSLSSISATFSIITYISFSSSGSYRTACQVRPHSRWLNVLRQALLLVISPVRLDHCEFSAYLSPFFCLSLAYLFISACLLLKAFCPFCQRTYQFGS